MYKGNKDIIVEENEFGTRVYEKNLLVGSTTWLMDGGTQLPFEHKGWIITTREFAISERVTPTSFYHAIRKTWSQDRKDFHLYDHNCALSLDEVIECIDMWNDDEDYV